MDITITPVEMKKLEEKYMAEYGVPGALLMEHAAMGICNALFRRCPGGHALFLCGPGNNGGDGYAAARLWHNMGGSSMIVELTDALKGDAALNRRLAGLSGIPMLSAASLQGRLPCCDVIVDALFGTGLSKPITGEGAKLICLANDSAQPVIAADIPSGLDGATGHTTGPCIRAAETITFHRMKDGLLLNDGPRYTGEITVQPILIPKDYSSYSGLHCMNPTDLSACIAGRDLFAHKGSFGRAVIFAGSAGMAGAAAFAANACIKTGAGLTTIVCPENILPIVQMLAPGATCIPLTMSGNALSDESLRRVNDVLAAATAVAAGCGSGHDPALPTLLEILRTTSCPVVLDADALNALSDAPTAFKDHPRVFLTPHPGEAARLLGCATRDITADALSALHHLQSRTGGNVLLKGARTLMTDGEHTAVNRFGTPAMAKGGSGDVLTGILVGLLAQNPHRPPLQALQLCALIHGLAGVRAEKLYGENSVMPHHLIEHIRLDDKDL